ncbi:MAG: HD domain-containing protein [Nitrospirota bacterium]
MPKQFIADLKEGDVVRSQFMVHKKQLRDFKNKPGKFLTLLVADKTGQVEAKVWDKAEEIALKFEEGDVVLLDGRVELYNDKPQLKVTNLVKVDEYETGDFLPKTSKDVDELFNYITSVDIQNRYLKSLLTSFFDDDGFVSLFKNAPAAKSLHHCYLGGLIEHTYEVIKMCELVCEIFPQIDRDFLLTGAILHDIGKMEELKFAKVFDYTDEGRLIGHVVMGERVVNEKMEAIPEFPKNLKMRMSHLLLSHHGEYEWGSPKKPKTLEACALHYADNLDAQVKRFIQIIEKEKDKTWADYDKLLERHIYIGEQTEE